MTTEKLNQIYESLKLHTKEYAVDEIFQLFIDNQITISELDTLLKRFSYVLSDDFFELDKTEQKQYHQHKKNIVHLVNNKETIETYSIFNKAYFDEMVEASAKNKSVTKALIEYVGQLDNLPIVIITMQNI